MNDQLLEQEGDQVSAWLKDWANKSNEIGRAHV